MSKRRILHETFESQQINHKLQWRCEPKNWFVDTVGSQLVVETDAETDYWQKTHYGFQADNGHFLYATTDENFRMTTKVLASPKSRYDQAGLMIRYSENTWLKTSLEYIPNGLSKLGAVVTNNGFSDWSTQYVEYTPNVHLFYRLSKIGQDCYVDFSVDGIEWRQIRIAHLDIPERSSVLAGAYACSPQGKGQSVRFEFLSIEKISGDPTAAYL